MLFILETSIHFGIILISLGHFIAHQNSSVECIFHLFDQVLLYDNYTFNSNLHYVLGN